MALLVVYCLIGLVVYAVTDSSSLASRVESRLPLVPDVFVTESVVFFVGALWPLWLALRARDRR